MQRNLGIRRFAHRRDLAAFGDAARVAERDGRLAEAAQLWERLAAEYPLSGYTFQALFLAGISEVRLGDFAAAWRERLSDTTPIDRGSAETAIRRMYRSLRLPDPDIVWTGSPSTAALRDCRGDTDFGYYPGDTVYLVLDDPDANRDPTATETVTITIAASKWNDVETVTLTDVAPTILSALDLAQPGMMEGTTLLPGMDWGGSRRVLLLILDGWGIGRQDDSNPIFLADTPAWDSLLATCPHSRLGASGEAVGLQAGKPGNSEAGHINLGSGRIILQDDVRLDAAMKDGTFQTNEVFLDTIREVQRRGTNLHLLGLLTEKSSHGSIDYPLAILQMAKEQGLERVFLHVIFDGRSTPPGSAPALLEKLEKQVEEIGIGQVVTGVGRGIALDRDGNYGKIKRAYDALVNGIGGTVPIQ